MNCEYSEYVLGGDRLARALEIGFKDEEDKLRFISILCLARKLVQSKATLAMIEDLLKELE